MYQIDNHPELLRIENIYFDSDSRITLSDEFLKMQKAINFVAASWWRRWIIRLASGGRVQFVKERK